ncbi:MAG: response regulator transcription factor [Chromatiales bacterium]|nr:response regulator transcription factor [Chromatiales bacterium]
MKVLVVDDEIPARQRLRSALAEIDGIDAVAEAADGEQALAEAQRFQPDVVLLDIRMPGLDGIEVAHRLGSQPGPPAVIFVTAYDEHALAAFDAHAVAYLLKPIRREKLEAALRHASVLTRPQLAALQATDAEPTPGAPRTHLSVSLRGNLNLIPVDEVFAFIAEHKYVVVYHQGGEALLETSLRVLEEEFAEQFLRIHRNGLVAKRHLTGIERGSDGSARARLAGTDRRFEVSRRHLKGLREWLRARGQHR